MCRVEQQGDLAFNVNASTHGAGGKQAKMLAMTLIFLLFRSFPVLDVLGGSVVI